MEEKSNKTFVSRIRDNPWILATFVLGAALIISLFINGSSVTGNSLNEKQIEDKVLTFLNSQVQSGQVELQDTTQENGLYKITVTYQGDTIPIYATVDGNYITADLIPLDGSANTATPDTASTGPVTIDYSRIATAPVKGNANAPVTIVEFSDFECPFCEKAYTESVKQIDEMYIKTGKVKLIYVNYPLGFHPEAQKAAEAALCFRDVKGGDTNYYLYHDKLFENQQSLSVSNYKLWAKQMGASSTKFDNCLDSGKFAALVASDQAYGNELGVSGTPAFFINGIELVGAQPLSAFQQVIDAELAKSA